MKSRIMLAALLLGAALPVFAQAQPAAQAAPVIEEGEASLLGWVQPRYPEAARKAGQQGQVQVEFIVGLDGGVTQAQAVDSTNEVFNEAALEAVRRWTFRPALEAGKPVVSAMRVPVAFDLRQLKQKRGPIAPAADRMPHGLKQAPARFKSAPDPDYPEELEERKLPGQVLLDLTVDETGHVQAPQVRWASHAAFVVTALRAAEKTEFEPAHQGPLPKATTVRYPVEFESMGARRAEMLAANHLAVSGNIAPDVLPMPFVLMEPVYPLEKQLAAEGGTAVAEFTLGQTGSVSEVNLVSCSAPEFGAALIAAVETWTLRPAMKGDARIPIRLRGSYEFTPPTEGAAYRLVTDLRTGGSELAKPSELDASPKPLWRGFPAYPQSLGKEAKTTGQAEIEFIIDRDGRARLPRIVSASAPAFGWAAAMAISQWVFDRPLRKGEPVDVRVHIPVTFAPPQ